MKKIKAERLRSGDTIGIVSPSSPAASLFPYRLERAKQQLQKMGFEVKLGRHAMEQQGYVSGNISDRIEDIHQMFKDPDVKAIIAAIGGNHSCQLINHIDYALVAENPKVFVGYSDILVLCMAIWQRTGLVTFYGPTIMTDFAENPKMPVYSKEYFLKAVNRTQPIGVVQPAAEHINEFVPWGTKHDIENTKKLETSPGWKCLRGGKARGILAGGCIEALDHLRSTYFWPTWDETILFLETASEEPNLAWLDAVLSDYINMGVFAKIRGLLFGRKNWPDTDIMQMHELILAKTESFLFPIIADMDFGHVLPMFTLPIGCEARIDGEALVLEIVEEGVK